MEEFLAVQRAAAPAFLSSDKKMPDQLDSELRRTEEAPVRYRLLALVSHVIQYQVPMFRSLAADPSLDLSVAFCSDWGLSAYDDEGFGHEVRWDLALEGFGYEFLRNWSLKPHPSRFWGLVNPSVATRIRRREFDAVWVHGWSHATSVIAMLAAFAAGVPVLLRGETNLLPTLPKWKILLKPAILSPLFRHISAFLAIGKNNGDFYRAHGVREERIFSVPYAVDNDFFTTRAAVLPPRPQLKRDLGVAPDLPLILFCGKLTPVKRPMDLLRAFEKSLRFRPAALLYVGDGILRGELEQYRAAHQIPNVYIAGFQNQTDLPRYFGAADVFALPSGSEPWGLVVNEAMNFGLPVVCSDQVGCAADLVKNGENGYIFPAGDIERLGDVLSAMLADEERRKAMGQCSRAIIDNWSFHEDLEGLLAALQCVVKDTSPSFAR